MPALYIAKSADVPAAAVRAGREAGRLLLRYSKSIPHVRVSVKPFSVYFSAFVRFFCSSRPRNRPFKAIGQRRRRRQRYGKARKRILLLPNQVAFVIRVGVCAGDRPRAEQPDGDCLMPDIKLHRHGGNKPRHRIGEDMPHQPARVGACHQQRRAPACPSPAADSSAPCG